MRVFISYRFTGENPEELKQVIPQLHEILEREGREVYSTIFDNEQFKNYECSGKKILGTALNEIDTSDVVLFFVRNEEISQGMLLELGYSIAKKKRMVLLINKKVKESIFRRQISEIIEFENFKEIKKIKI